MASRSSQRKSALSISRDFAIRLLQDGTVIPDPSQELINAAAFLEKNGVIEINVQEYILCADPRDSDFPPKNRHCNGRIHIDDGLDEAGHEFRCPECERPVFPFRYKKRRHKELRSQINQKGLSAYILSQLTKIDPCPKELCTGVYRIDIGNLGVILCIADFCSDEKFLTRDWACTHTTCYLVINPNDADERFLDDEWILRKSVADIVCGDSDINEWVSNVADSAPPQSVRRASIPVYTKGAMPIIAEPIVAHQAGRRFIVECGPSTVRIEGELVVAPQAGTRFEVFSILWNQFIDNMRQADPPEQYGLLSIKELTDKIKSRTGKPVDDESTVRRAINRLQNDIENTVKRKIGLPIDREDIIQTCRWKGQGEGDHGYRINPFTVAARPFQTNNS